MSKWKHTKIMKLCGGLFGNHTEICRAINVNADALQECCQKVKALEEKVEILQDFNLKLTDMNALEKQIPKEPIDKIMYKQCPVCGAVDLGRYCMECGQAIKWE